MKTMTMTLASLLLFAGCGAAPPRLNASLAQQDITIRKLEGADGPLLLRHSQKGYKLRDSANNKLGKIKFKTKSIKIKHKKKQLARAKRKDSGFRVYHGDGKVALTFKKTKNRGYKIKDADKKTVGKLEQTSGEVGESKITTERDAETQKVYRDGMLVAEVDESVPAEAALMLGLTKELTIHERIVAMLARMVF